MARRSPVVAAAVAWVLLVSLTAPAVRGFTGSAGAGRGRHLRSLPRGQVVQQATLSEGATCIAVGSGYIHLLAAKASALAGYKTYVLTTEEKIPTFEELVYEPKGCPKGSLPLTFLPVSAKDECEAVLQSAEGVLIASDGVIEPPAFYASENCISQAVLDTVVPEDGTTKVKKIVAMSRFGVSGRPGSGSGYGPTVQAAKDFSNSDVWAKGSVKAYQEMEAAVMAKARAVGADYTIVRAGTLKGGGPGGETAKGSGEYPHALRGLSPLFYRLGMVPKPNWKLLFDMDTQGVVLLPGDTAKGPGFFAPTKSTSSNPEPGDSGRVGVANAMVQSLTQPAAANTDFSVCTASAREPPTQEEWDTLFGSLQQ